MNYYYHPKHPIRENPGIAHIVAPIYCGAVYLREPAHVYYYSRDARIHKPPAGVSYSRSGIGLGWGGYGQAGRTGPKSTGKYRGSEKSTTKLKMCPLTFAGIRYRTNSTGVPP